MFPVMSSFYHKELLTLLTAMENRQAGVVIPCWTFQHNWGMYLFLLTNCMSCHISFLILIESNLSLPIGGTYLASLLFQLLKILLVPWPYHSMDVTVCCGPAGAPRRCHGSLSKWPLCPAEECGPTHSEHGSPNLRWGFTLVCPFPAWRSIF